MALTNPQDSLPQDILQELQAIENLVSLPEVYLQIRRAISDVSADMDDFTNIIRMDVNLSATLLRIVNSAFYGFPRKIESITRAIHILGIGQVHEIALSVCAIASLKLPNDIVPLRTFWRRSLLAGNLSRLLAKEKGLPKTERVFVAGLLNDIGHMILYAVFPTLSRNLLDRYQAGSVRIDQIEEQQLALHYGNIGAFVMRQWELPEFYQSVTQHHPRPANANQYQMEAALVHLGHGYAVAGLDSPITEVQKMLDPAVWEIAQLAAEDLPPLLEEAQAMTSDMEKTLLAGID